MIRNDSMKKNHYSESNINNRLYDTSNKNYKSYKSLNHTLLKNDSKKLFNRK